MIHEHSKSGYFLWLFRFLICIFGYALLIRPELPTFSKSLFIPEPYRLLQKIGGIYQEIPDAKKSIAAKKHDGLFIMYPSYETSKRAFRPYFPKIRRNSSACAMGMLWTRT